ncbi:cell envelope integrity protein TolA [Duganella sp. FT135W]|uniref:Cell envelope integrity protein TolA n=1 Tax=Duganella flavida TaxID=2692175 RepID=A0A6L8KK52_9BURK|nr:cell envelope integrity protein TolA [Duganella flavida]MYM26164.1 cell envelope integrity protein TolA [Duganella flavida]
MTPATAGGPYKVPRQHDNWRSITLSVVMHAVLLMFLWIGVSWQNNEPVEVQAEIWDMKVEQAAPTPTPEPAPQPEPEPEAVKPPPAPVVEAPPVPREDPEIALQRIKKKKQEEEKAEKLEQARLKKEADDKLAKLEAKKKAEQQAKEEKAEQEAKEKALAEKDKKKAATEKLAKEKAEKAAKEKAFAAEMSRITGAAAKGSTGTAAQSTGGRVDGGYRAAVIAKIRGNMSGNWDNSLSATYSITQLPSGEIIGVRKVKGSGTDAYDRAIESAINASSPLPKKKDGTVERDITADFNMKDMH